MLLKIKEILDFLLAQQVQTSKKILFHKKQEFMIKTFLLIMNHDNNKNWQEINLDLFLLSMTNIDTTFYEEFFEQQGVPEDRARFYLCSLLQKGARSGCIYKNELIMKRIMKARNILGFNMYISKFIPCQKLPKVYQL